MELFSEVGIEEFAYISSFLIFFIERVVTYFKVKKKKLSSGAKGFEKNWLLNEALYPLLYDLMMEHNSVRAFIVQFHNGEQFYSGQSIQKMTCSHEVKRPGVKGVKSAIIAVPVDDEVHRIVMDIRKDEYFTIENVDNEEDIDLRERLTYLGVKCKYCFGIHDQEGRITGILYLHFNHLSPIHPNQVQGIKMTVNQISTLLSKTSYS